MTQDKKLIDLFKSNLNKFMGMNTHVREESIQKHVRELGIIQIRGFGDYQRMNGEFQNKLINRGLDTTNSLLLSRLWEYQFRHLHWLIFSISSGMYKEAIMEMRFILESWVQAYYIDLSYESKSLTEKINLLLKKESLMDKNRRTIKLNWYGKQLFDRTFQLVDFRGDIYDFYRDLCNFSHSSYPELSKYQQAQTIQDKLLMADPEFNEEMFKACMDYFNKMHDFLIRIVSEIYVNPL